MLGGSVSAKAADLGGDCCADLEERIAELEATTARKGNRKVSLKISGFVNQAVFFWDDGTERNVYVGTNSLEQDRFAFSGEAKINSEWSAGYVIEIGVKGADSGAFSQSSTGSSNSLSIRKSYWFLKSSKLGQVAVGQNGTASYHAVDDADIANTRYYSDFEAASVAMLGFQLRSGGTAIGGGVTWKNVLTGWNNGAPGQSSRKNVVKYDSPTFAGFSVSAAWGEDDLWDVGANYKGKLGEFSIAAKAGYGESTDPAATNCGGSAGDFRCQWFGAGATIMHDPTGLYVFGGYGWQKSDTLANFGVDDSGSTWLIQPGIERKWHPLGKTTIYGEYRHDELAGSHTTVGATTTNVANGEIDYFGGGVVQNIEAAAMDLYVIYRHTEGDIRLLGDTTDTSLDDFDMVITGARIQF